MFHLLSRVCAYVCSYCPPPSASLHVKMKGRNKVTDGTSGKIIKVVANQESSYYLCENRQVRACDRNDEG